MKKEDESKANETLIYASHHMSALRWSSCRPWKMLWSMGKDWMMGKNTEFETWRIGTWRDSSNDTKERSIEITWDLKKGRALVEIFKEKESALRKVVELDPVDVHLDPEGNQLDLALIEGVILRLAGREWEEWGEMG